MDHLNYYGVPKENFLEIDTAASNNPYALRTNAMGPIEDNQATHSPTYANEENSPKNGTKSSLYKTELCKRFSEFGNCRYGAKCQFAHGVAELRHVVRHPKYKTTKCKSYWGSGHCPYGSRCRFIHEETEALQNTQYGASLFKDPMNPLAPPTPELMTTATNGFVYGERANDPTVPVLSGYSKDYPLMSSSYDKNSWSVQRPEPRLNYGAGQYAPMKPMNINSTGSNRPSQPPRSSQSFPDLQDTIDALVKFSLSPSDPKPQVTPPENPLRLETPLKRAEYAFDTQGLWKDFPSLDTSNQLADDFTSKPWSSTVLSLDLDGKTFDSKSPESREDNNQTAGDSPSSKGETSPRLSVFERFH